MNIKGSSRLSDWVREFYSPNSEWKKWIRQVNAKGALVDTAAQVARDKRRVKAIRMEKQAQAAHDKRSKMTKRFAVDSLVRRKNEVYRKWRKEHTFPRIERACVECMMRFGALPRWDEWVNANRTRDWQMAEVIQKEHQAWRAEVREWALKEGITRFEKQSAQFLKFYFAWWRHEHETRDGPVTRTYGRQMS